MYSASPIRFSTVKKRFPQGHIESAYGSSAENKDYILKAGKWKNTSKTETSIAGTFEEYGIMPAKETMSEKGELQFYLRYDRKRTKHSRNIKSISTGYAVIWTK